jgi:hypothetical protein
VLASRRTRGIRATTVAAIPAAMMTARMIQMAVWLLPEVVWTSMSPAAKGMAMRNSRALTTHSAVETTAPELTAAVASDPLTLEEPDPDGEDSDVTADQRAEGIGHLERRAPPVWQLADDGARQRPGRGERRQLGEDERRSSSPSYSLGSLARDERCTQDWRSGSLISSLGLRIARRA